MNQRTPFIELPSASMQAIYNIIQQVVKSKSPFLFLAKPVLVRKASQDIFT